MIIYWLNVLYQDPVKENCWKIGNLWSLNFMAAILIFFLQISIENHEMMMWEENTKWNKINVLSFFSPQPLPEFSVVICTRFSCLRMYMEREFRDVFQKKSNRHIAPDTLWNSLFQNTINSEPVKTNTNRTFCEHNFYFS